MSLREQLEVQAFGRVVRAQCETIAARWLDALRWQSIGWQWLAEMEGAIVEILPPEGDALS